MRKTCPSEVVVPSRRPFGPTRAFTVTNGDIINVPTVGVWSPDGSFGVGPNGTTWPAAQAGFLSPAPWACLIAFVGPNPYLDDQGNNRWQDGTTYFPRPYGTNYYFVGAAGVFTNTLRPGKLWFGFNDDGVAGTTINDNSGFVHGTVQITHP